MNAAATSLVSNLPLRGGTLYFPTQGDESPGAFPADIATAVLESVLGPTPGTCVLLVHERDVADAVAAGLAARCATLTGRHPNAPWGVLLLKEGAEHVEDGAAQIRSSQGNVIVVYSVPDSPAMPRAAFVRTVTSSTSNPYVVLMAPSVWEHEQVEPSDVDLLDHVTSVVDATAVPGALTCRLREHANKLEAFHGITITDATVAAAAADDLPAAEMVGGFVRPARQPDLGRRRLDRWAARAALNGTDVAAPRSAALNVTELRDRLTAVVHGQDAAVQAVAEQVALGQAGLRMRDDRPRSALLLTGPTGTGKSLLATVLADVLGGSGRLVRVNLSGMPDAHDIATLLGSPPGYVGSSDSGRWLTTRIAARPDAVLLLDEIDKAHATVWTSVLLELLGAGTLTDAQGRVVDARGLHVVLTANLGAAAMTRRGAGFGDPTPSKEAALRAVREAVPDEVFNRIDAVVAMAPLSGGAVDEILDASLTAVEQRLRSFGFCVTVTPAARAALARDGISVRDGARLLHRTVERLVLAPLLTCPPGAYVIDASNDRVTLRSV